MDFDRISYLEGGKRVFLISGEIHYFRVPRDQWRDRLLKLKEAGGNCVATYVPWVLHEPKEGQFCFDAQYNVEEFLRICHDVGIYAMVRPGPYQYSELMYDGLPRWLCENYPEVRARTIDGREYRASSISYMHPLFMEKARRWFEKVVPILGKHQVDRGGAVAAIQFDNELMGIHEWFGGWDYHPETMGVGRDTGRWPTFLQGKYGSARSAGMAFGVEAETYAELVPPASAGGLKSRSRMIKDYQECYFRQVAEYASTLAGWMRELGMRVPTVHNAAGPAMNAYFAEVRDAMGEKFLLGSDHYFNLDLNWPQNNPTPQWALRCFTSLELLRLWGYPPTVFELPGGSASDYPPFTATDAACCYMTNVALGMKGFNYYIFAGGPNPPGAGVTTDLYDYGAAVSADGVKRPLFAVQQRLAQFLHENEWLANARAMAEVRVGFDHEMCRAQKYADGQNLLMSPQQAWDLLRHGVLLSSLCAGITPELCDLRGDDFVADRRTPVIAVTWDCMHRDIQRRLVRFVQEGGRVLLVGVVPTMGEDFEPCTILQDYLGGCGQEVARRDVQRLDAFGVSNVRIGGALYALRNLPHDGHVTAMQTHEPWFAVGFRRPNSEGGAISVLGLRWLHSMREHSEMLRNALAELGHAALVECSNPNVWIIPRTDGATTMLFAINVLSAPMRAKVRHRTSAHSAWVDVPELAIDAMRVCVLRPGGIWIDPCEVDRL